MNRCEKNMIMMAAAVISIMLLLIARHHPPSRRKIKEIRHGYVSYSHSNTTMLRSSWSVFVNQTWNDLQNEIDMLSSTFTKHPSITKWDRIMRNGYDYSPIVIEKYKLLIFTIPKNACTVIKQLARRIMGFKDWKKENVEIPHNPEKNGLKYLRSFPIEQATEMMTSPKWTRAIFLREPYTRLLSAYLDKAESENFVEKRCGKQPTNFSSFIKLIPTCKDPHWSLQKSFVDDKWWPYINFRGRVSTAARDMKELLEKEGLWQQFGSNGWSNGAIFEKNRATHATGAQNKIDYYYDDDIRETVREMYAEDFELVK